MENWLVVVGLDLLFKLIQILFCAFFFFFATHATKHMFLQHTFWLVASIAGCMQLKMSFVTTKIWITLAAKS